MKIKKSFQQVICILIILATQEDQIPLKSELISKRLGVSDSYFKKIIRALVVAGLIKSDASKTGGFTLQANPKEISLLDIFEVVEGKSTFIQDVSLVNKVFKRPDLSEEKITYVFSVFEKAEYKYKETLKQVTLADLLKDEDACLGPYDWRKHRENKEKR